MPTSNDTSIMKALVFHHPGKVSVDNVSDPKIEHSEDVILRVTATAICGSDLHIYNGFFPQKEDMVLGHEFMGVVEETGSKVTALKTGDRVVVPFPIACGGCFFCQHGLPGHCENSNPEKYGPEGGRWIRKAARSLATQTFMAATTAARPSTSGCRMQTSGRAK